MINSFSFVDTRPRCNSLCNNVIILPPLTKRDLIKVHSGMPINEFIKSLPNPKIEINALWDTGSTHTCIEEGILKSMGLEPHSTMASVIGMFGRSSELPLYGVNLLLKNGILIDNFEMVGVQAIAGDPEMLIGMDIIGLGDFATTTLINPNSGKHSTRFSFSMPASRSFDFKNEKTDTDE